MQTYDLDAFLAEQGAVEAPTIKLGGREWTLPLDVSAGEHFRVKNLLILAAELEELKDDDPLRELTDEEEQKFRQLGAFDYAAELDRFAGQDLADYLREHVHPGDLQAIFWRIFGIHETHHATSRAEGNAKRRKARKQPEDRKPKATKARRSTSSDDDGGPSKPTSTESTESS